MTQEAPLVFLKKVLIMLKTILIDKSLSRLSFWMIIALAQADIIKVHSNNNS